MCWARLERRRGRHSSTSYSHQPWERRRELRFQYLSGNRKTWLAELQLAKQESLALALSEESGFKLRQLISRDNVQASRAVSMTGPTRTLVDLFSLIPREDAEQVIAFQGLVYVPQHFLERDMLPTMQLRKILEEEGNQPSEKNGTYYQEVQKQPWCTSSSGKPKHKAVLLTRVNWER